MSAAAIVVALIASTASANTLDAMLICVAAVPISPSPTSVALIKAV
jgi:hypothetical protein